MTDFIGNKNVFVSECLIADQGKRSLIALRTREIKNDTGRGLGTKPRALSNFRFELPGIPHRAAQNRIDFVRPFSFGCSAQNVVRDRQGNAGFRVFKVRSEPLTLRRMQNERHHRMHGTAPTEGNVPLRRRTLELLTGFGKRKLSFLIELSLIHI